MIFPMENLQIWGPCFWKKPVFEVIEANKKGNIAHTEIWLLAEPGELRRNNIDIP